MTLANAIGRRALLAAFLIAGLIACGDGTVDPETPGQITGTVTIDGVGAAAISVNLSGMATASTTSDESGAFSFTDLEAGSYTVSISGTDTELVTFERSSVEIVVAAGARETVRFSGTPTGVQRVLVYAYYGIEGTKPNVAPAPGFQVDIYRTSADRDGEANRLGRATTDGSGRALFTFDRADDTDEGGGATDNTIYTRVTGVPGPKQIGQTDLMQTVNYANHEVVALAPDTIDALNADVSVEFRIQTLQTSYTGPEGSGLLKPEWITHSRTDTAGSTIVQHETGFDGVARFDLFADLGDLPLTLYFRAQDSQGSDAGNLWTQTPEPTAVASGTGRFMTYVHDGTQAPGTLDLGVQRIEYVTQSIFAPVYHERDLAEATPIHTPGSDDYDDATNITVEILADDQTTVLYSRSASSNGHAFWNGPRFGAEPFRAELIAQDVYYVRATSTDPDMEIVSPTIYQVGEAGGGSVGTFGPGAGGFRHSARVCPLAADTAIANCGAFAYKFNNTTVRGTIRAGGVGVSGMTVDLYRCVPPDTASCTRDGDPVSTTTNGSGVFTFTGNLEDIYEIVPNPGSTGHSSATPDGGSPVVVTRGKGDTATKNFTAN